MRTTGNGIEIDDALLDMPKTLVIIPCGAAKCWRKRPDLGAVPASLAYTGTPFRVNKSYAERFGDRWLILSARYGLIEPDHPVTDYNTTFTDPSSNPVFVETLREQVALLTPGEYERVIGLGGAAYREALATAFAPFSVTPIFPFAGLTLGRSMRAVKRAVSENNPVPINPRK
ncbi:MAG: hypothetical protein LC800_20705 [Acidobacteria bacterium]|nr:hypothetical protein [Acidobacteriota bacterium]